MAMADHVPPLCSHVVLSSFRTKFDFTVAREVCRLHIFVYPFLYLSLLGWPSHCSLICQASPASGPLHLLLMLLLVSRLLPSLPPGLLLTEAFLDHHHMDSSRDPRILLFFPTVLTTICRLEPCLSPPLAHQT